MRGLIIFIFVITSFCSYGQSTVSNDFKRFQIGINFSPDVAYRILKRNDGSSTSNTMIDWRNKNEVPKFGYTAGLNFGYNIKSFIGIETGIQYSNKGFQTKKQTLTFDPLFGISSITYKSIEDFHYIDIPVKVNLTIGKQKVRFFTSIGLITNILVQATNTSIFEENGKVTKDTDKSTWDYNRINLSPMLSLGIDYKINNQMNLRVEPTFRFGALKIIDTPITSYLYCGGINVSYYFGL